MTWCLHLRANYCRGFGVVANSDARKSPVGKISSNSLKDADHHCRALEKQPERAWSATRNVKPRGPTSVRRGQKVQEGLRADISASFRRRPLQKTPVDWRGLGTATRRGNPRFSGGEKDIPATGFPMTRIANGSIGYSSPGLRRQRRRRYGATFEPYEPTFSAG